MDHDQFNAETRAAKARLAGACGKRRGFSPGAAARHSQSARVGAKRPGADCILPGGLHPGYCIRARILHGQGIGQRW